MKNHPSQRYCTLYITNQVMAIKGRYVPFFVYNSTNLKKIEKRLEKTAKRYPLTDIYLFHICDQFKPKTYGICLKSFQKRRLKKIIWYAHSANLSEFEKYKVLRLQFSGRMFGNESYMEDGPKYLKTIKSSEDINKKSFISRGHFNFLKSFGVPLFDFQNQHGDNNVMTTTCWFTTGEGL